MCVCVCVVCVCVCVCVLYTQITNIYVTEPLYYNFALGGTFCVSCTPGTYYNATGASDSASQLNSETR